MKKIIVGKNEANQRVDKFLRKYMPKAPLSFIYKMLRKKYIKVNDKKTSNEYILREEDLIDFYLSEDVITGFQEEKKIIPVDRSFSIVYEDDNILLVGKPSGLIMHSDKNEDKNTLINQVINYLYDKGEYNPKAEKTFVPASVNRLDRNTSGIVIIGKTYKAVQELNEMLRKNHIKKYYSTIVKGVINEDLVLDGYIIKDERRNQVSIVDREVIGSKYIHTVIKPKKCSKDFTLLEVEIITGKSHQIRLHLASIGHPIIGDPKYGEHLTNRKMKENFALKNQFLHAYQVYFKEGLDQLNYLSGKRFVCPVPSELKRIEDELFD